MDVVSQYVCRYMCIAVHTVCLSKCVVVSFTWLYASSHPIYSFNGFPVLPHPEHRALTFQPSLSPL